MKNRRGSLRLWCLGAILGSLLGIPVSRADEMRDLAARIELLEQESAQLRQELEASRRALPPEPEPFLPAAYQATAVPPTPSDVPCLTGDCDGTSSGAESANGPFPAHAFWKYGMQLETEDKKFRTQIGGRTQFDGVWIQDDPKAFIGAGGDGDADAVNFRRARIRAEGKMYEFIDWAVEFDFVNSANNNSGIEPASEANVIHTPVPTDLWVNFSGVPLLKNIIIGNFKDPIGFEHMTSSRFLNFMERSFNQDAFTGGFNNGFAPGIAFWRDYANSRGTIASGFFKTTTNPYGYGVGDGEYAWTSRVTFLPLWADDGERLLHVGGAYSIRDPNNDLITYRSRGSVRNGPPSLNPILASTGAIGTDQIQLVATEVAMQWDSLVVEGEYIGAWNANAIGEGTTAPLGAQLGTVYVHGWHVEALYFLTGEHRHYDKAKAVFGRVIPKENFRWGEGLGAWQIGVRYSHLDLDDGDLRGGVLSDVTLGLNWFLNPNLKIQANYVYTDRKAPADFGGGNYSGFGMRLAHDF